jgi:hypothetical protein
VYKVQYAYSNFKSKAEAEKSFAARKELFHQSGGLHRALVQQPEEFLKNAAASAVAGTEKVSPENVLVVYKPSTSL